MEFLIIGLKLCLGRDIWVTQIMKPHIRVTDGCNHFLEIVVDHARAQICAQPLVNTRFHTQGQLTVQQDIGVLLLDGVQILPQDSLAAPWHLPAIPPPDSCMSEGMRSTPSMTSGRVMGRVFGWGWPRLMVRLDWVTVH